MMLSARLEFTPTGFMFLDRGLCTSIDFDFRCES